MYVDGGEIRFRDPATGRKLLTLEETELALRESRQAQAEAQQDRRERAQAERALRDERNKRAETELALKKAHARIAELERKPPPASSSPRPRR